MHLITRIAAGMVVVLISSGLSRADETSLVRRNYHVGVLGSHVASVSFPRSVFVFSDGFLSPAEDRDELAATSPAFVLGLGWAGDSENPWYADVDLEFSVASFDGQAAASGPGSRGLGETGRSATFFGLTGQFGRMTSRRFGAHGLFGFGLDFKKDGSYDELESPIFLGGGARLFLTRQWALQAEYRLGFNSAGQGCEDTDGDGYCTIYVSGPRFAAGHAGAEGALREYRAETLRHRVGLGVLLVLGR